MNPTVELLFCLLRVALHPGRSEQVVWSENPDWAVLFRLATAQGVSAIAWDGLVRLRREGQLPAEYELPRALKLQWAMQVSKIEQRYERQLRSATELADYFAQNGVRTVVLKGFAISELYPIPNHRECGDLDCFLCGDYERGNQLAEALGAKVRRDFYKHSHIEYKRLMVENHQFCTAIRGANERKVFERHLQQLLGEGMNHRLACSVLEIPSSDFNVLFLTAHGMSHFLSEGLKLRHLCDWVCLLQERSGEINWQMINEWTKQMAYDCFVATMTALAVSHLGLSVVGAELQTDNRYADRVLTDMLRIDLSIFNSGKSRMAQRWMMVRNRFSAIWKYRLIYRRSLMVDLARAIYAFFFERKPKLAK